MVILYQLKVIIREVEGLLICLECLSVIWGVKMQQKIKRLSFKYIEDKDKYVVIKVQNVKGFKPQQELSQSEVDKLEQTEIEVVIKW